MELVWGIQTLSIRPYQSMDDILTQVDHLLVHYGLARTGDRIIVTLGQPIASGSKTNSLFVHTVAAETTVKGEDSTLPLRCQEDPAID